MNVVSRGAKNAFRSPIRSISIILMLAISIGLILSMLVARSSINSKISEIKSSTGTTVTISPAGMGGGGMGGSSDSGNALTSSQLATIQKTSHVASTTEGLTDRMSSSDTNLISSLELGNLGARAERFDSSSSSNSSSSSSSDSSSSNNDFATKAASITVVGTTNSNSVSTDGSSLDITSGSNIDGSSSDLVALVGTSLASKNNLKVGSTFTAYTKTITVKGIYKTSNTFQDSEVIMPLATVQTLTSQSGEISSIVATIDSSENVSSTVTALKSALGSKVDITSEQQEAENSISSLESIASLALAGVIGASVAGAVIVLLAMIMIVRERRREIGVIKAIGGSDAKVILQFMSEAISLTIVGAIVGLIFGILVSGPMTISLTTSSSSTSQVSGNGGNSGDGAPSSTNTSTSSSSSSSSQPSGGMMQRGMQQLNRNFTQVTASLTPQVFAAAIGITLLIAIIGSAIPAWFIARIRPSEVLKTEE